MRITALRIGMLLIITGLMSCLSLDPFLFEGLEEDTYQLDDYTGVRECDSYISQNGPFNLAYSHEFSRKSGGETIYGIYLRHDSTQFTLAASDTIIVYFHGNADNLDRYWPRTRMLWHTGYPVIVFDYRGYGKSTGSTSEQSLYEDAAQIMSYVHDSLGDPRVIIYGFSLGSIPATDVASRPVDYPSVVMLSLEAPIGKVETIVENGTYLDIPGSYLTTFSGNNAEKIKNVSVPFLWLSGTIDDALPRETHGQVIWDNYPDPDSLGRFIIINGAGHVTIPQTMSSDYLDYIGCLRQFYHDSTNTNPWFQKK